MIKGTKSSGLGRKPAKPAIDTPEGLEVFYHVAAGIVTDRNYMKAIAEDIGKKAPTIDFFLKKLQSEKKDGQLVREGEIRKIKSESQFYIAFEPNWSKLNKIAYHLAYSKLFSKKDINIFKSRFIRVLFARFCLFKLEQVKRDPLYHHLEHQLSGLNDLLNEFFLIFHYVNTNMKKSNLDILKQFYGTSSPNFKGKFKGLPNTLEKLQAKYLKDIDNLMKQKEYYNQHGSKSHIDIKGVNEDISDLKKRLASIKIEQIAIPEANKLAKAIYDRNKISQEEAFLKLLEDMHGLK